MVVDRLHPVLLLNDDSREVATEHLGVRVHEILGGEPDDGPVRVKRLVRCDRLESQVRLARTGVADDLNPVVGRPPPTEGGVQVERP